MTYDQGSKMALHTQIGHLLNDGVFLAEAANPWQRGTNENTNRLRRYFPNGTDLSIHTL